MKISDIKAYPTWVGHRNQLIVKVETDEGIHGWGESVTTGSFCSAATRAKSGGSGRRCTAASTLKAGEC